ncbi:beta-1,3-glucan-binding protein-like [Colias croceus]|uniref:beta-1,3-glucan-binding protein-like n=1 Tax=Colias crocea TaxID=72248 RepID=UPI001E27D024|nr:beta-1,3-glucan-binding protein-like [Colias croceus]
MHRVVLEEDDPKIEFVQYEAVFYNKNSDNDGYTRDKVFYKTNGKWLMDKPNLIGKSDNTTLLKIKNTPLESVNYVNAYLANIGNKLADEIGISNIGVKTLEEEDTNLTSLCLLDTDVDEVHKVISNLKEDSAPGWDVTKKPSSFSELEEIKPAAKKNKCFGISKVPGRDVCSDDVIYEENFDTFREDFWNIDQYIPYDHPEHPFISYQKLEGANSTVFVENGSLYIRPKFQQNLPGFDESSLYKGTLDLTSHDGVKFVSQSTFAFKYGTMHVRAKLPIGDWLYPEILLESLYNKYGSLHYSSGILKIAMVRGNTEQNKPKFNSQVLKGGPVFNSHCWGAFDFYSKKPSDGRSWGDDFHNYSVTCSPEPPPFIRKLNKWVSASIKIVVDGKTWVPFKPGSGGLKSWLPRNCRGDWYKLLDGAPKIAPFDDYFYITFGVAAGGFFEFPDDLVTGDGTPKPWNNGDPKAVYNFWDKRDEWIDSWDDPELVIDYVKVIALSRRNSYNN